MYVREQTTNLFWVLPYARFCYQSNVGTNVERMEHNRRRISMMWCIANIQFIRIYSLTASRTNSTKPKFLIDGTDDCAAFAYKKPIHYTRQPYYKPNRTSERSNDSMQFLSFHRISLSWSALIFGCLPFFPDDNLHISTLHTISISVNGRVHVRIVK